MAPIYASVAEMRVYVEDNPAVAAVLGDDATVERLLERNEHRVDGVLGPYPIDPDSGLKLNPTDLTTPQKDALSRATCAAAEHEVMVGHDFLVGEEDLIPGELQVLRRGSRQAPKMVEELAGTGLVTYSGTVATEAAAR
jgi:hypothetical protein